MLSNVFLYLKMGDNLDILSTMFETFLQALNYFQNGSKCQYLKYHNCYEYTKIVKLKRV